MAFPLSNRASTPESSQVQNGEHQQPVARNLPVNNSSETIQTNVAAPQQPVLDEPIYVNWPPPIDMDAQSQEQPQASPSGNLSRLERSIQSRIRDSYLPSSFLATIEAIADLFIPYVNPNRSIRSYELSNSHHFDFCKNMPMNAFLAYLSALLNAYYRLENSQADPQQHLQTQLRQIIASCSQQTAAVSNDGTIPENLAQWGQQEFASFILNTLSFYLDINLTNHGLNQTFPSPALGNYQNTITTPTSSDSLNLRQVKSRTPLAESITYRLDLSNLETNLTEIFEQVTDIFIPYLNPNLIIESEQLRAYFGKSGLNILSSTKLSDFIPNMINAMRWYIGHHTELASTDVNLLKDIQQAIMLLNPVHQFMNQHSRSIRVELESESTKQEKTVICSFNKSNFAYFILMSFCGFLDMHRERIYEEIDKPRHSQFVYYKVEFLRNLIDNKAVTVVRKLHYIYQKLVVSSKKLPSEQTLDFLSTLTEQYQIPRLSDPEFAGLVVHLLQLYLNANSSTHSSNNERRSAYYTSFFSWIIERLKPFSKFSFNVPMEYFQNFIALSETELTWHLVEIIELFFANAGNEIKVSHYERPDDLEEDAQLENANDAEEDTQLENVNDVAEEAQFENVNDAEEENNGSLLFLDSDSDTWSTDYDFSGPIPIFIGDDENESSDNEECTRL